MTCVPHEDDLFNDDKDSGSYFHIIHIHLYTTEQIIFLLSCAHNFLFFDGTILKQSEQIIVWIQNTLYTRG